MRRVRLDVVEERGGKSFLV